MVERTKLTHGRYQTDNPGPWFLHCHVDWHLQAGLAVVMAEDTPDVGFDNPVPRKFIYIPPKVTI